MTELLDKIKEKIDKIKEEMNECLDKEDYIDYIDYGKIQLITKREKKDPFITETFYMIYLTTIKITIGKKETHFKEINKIECVKDIDTLLRSSCECECV